MTIRAKLDKAGIRQVRNRRRVSADQVAIAERSTHLV